MFTVELYAGDYLSLFASNLKNKAFMNLQTTLSVERL